MGAFSIWHWIIVLIVLSVPAFLGLAIWFVVRAVARSSASASVPVPQVAPVSLRPPTEARLRELASLRSKGLLTDEEYERQRAVVIRGV